MEAACPLFLTINQQDGKLSGSIATGNGAKPATIDSAELHDGKFVDVHDNAGRLVKFRLELTGNGLDGESTVGGQTSKVSLARPTAGGIVTAEGRVVEGGGAGRGSGDRAQVGSGLAAVKVSAGVFIALEAAFRPRF
jgi:hypothetical protein